jgi:hypothetical protein
MHKTIACGAGFAGDRIEPAVTLAGSGAVDAVVLECLAERTLVPGLRARRTDPDAGFDPRLRRRLTPLLPVARRNRCRIISNLGAANPAAAARHTARLAQELGLSGIRIAGVTGDDVMHLREQVSWQDPIGGELLGAHAYIGADGLVEAVQAGADVVLTGRAADSVLFAAEVMPILTNGHDALAGAVAIGHLLECSGQITGGNFEGPNGDMLSATEFARLGFPMAKVAPDGTAEIGLMNGEPGRVDLLTCTLQLLYEVHDPSAYITPDVIIDFTGIRFEELGHNRVRVGGASARGRPDRLKVSGFVEAPGFVADVEIGYAGVGAYGRARVAADALALRLEGFDRDDIQIDLVGINSILGDASAPSFNPSEVRVHVSARCPDGEIAQWVEDEVYALTLSGPAGGGSVRSERRARLDVVDGLIDRNLVEIDVVWETAA